MAEPAAVAAAPAEPTMRQLTSAEADEINKKIEQLLVKADRDPIGESLEMLKLVLAEYGNALSQTLRPDNRLHPDVSFYNPKGERDHPRPKLKRPVYFMGVPQEPPTLTANEIHLYNQFTTTLVHPVLQWKAIMLRDQSGNESLYLSVPFQGWDSLKNLGTIAVPNDETGEIEILAGQRMLCYRLLTEGQRPENQDLLLERIAAAEATIKKLEAAQPEPPQPAA